MIYAYIVGRGDSPLNSVTVAKDYAKEIHKFYENNFTQLPVGIKRKENIPTEFKLFQNYPNPFNPSTTIKYSIPVGNGNFSSFQHVTLKVYDILGREVATLVNKEQIPGNYSVIFNASNLASGMYFYKLIFGGVSETRKMLLIR